MNIKKTLVKEARFLSETTRDNARISAFANTYFTCAKARELEDAIKKSPHSAENWIIKNY